MTQQDEDIALETWHQRLKFLFCAGFVLRYRYDFFLPALILSSRAQQPFGEFESYIMRHYS